MEKQATGAMLVTPELPVPHMRKKEPATHAVSCFGYAMSMESLGVSMGTRQRWDVLHDHRLLVSSGHDSHALGSTG